MRSLQKWWHSLWLRRSSCAAPPQACASSVVRAALTVSECYRWRCGTTINETQSWDDRPSKWRWYNARVVIYRFWTDSYWMCWTGPGIRSVSNVLNVNLIYLKSVSLATENSFAETTSLSKSCFICFYILFIFWKIVKND